MNLFTRYLNSAAVFIPPDDTAAKQREEIQVTASTHNENENQNDNSEGAKDETENSNQSQDEEDQDDGENSSDEDTEDDKENENGETGTEDKENETEEQKEKRISKEREERKAARQQRKWDRLAAEKTAAEKRVQELEAQLKETPNEGLTEEEVERRAEEKALLKLQEKQAAEAKKAFDDNCDALEAQAAKAAKVTVEQFRTDLRELVNDLGPIPTDMINALADLDNKNGGQVLNYLMDNIDEAEELYGLSPIKMAQRLVRISDKIAEAEKPKPRQRSNAPRPLEAINESGRKGAEQLNDKMSMDDFVRIRNKQTEKYRKSKGYL